MKKYVGALLAGSSIFTLAPAAAAQEQSDEIVVTARRQAESLQDVPLTVNAVTSEQISEYALTKPEDISTVVPGLNLSNGTTGYSSFASVRGVSFDTSSSASATVQFYINDAPVETNRALNSLFDIGQVEVLRGPQGTTRGMSSPSGAITLTTRAPDMDEYGGTFSTTLTDLNAANFQGALNIPIISNVLALRVAGVYDTNEGDGVRSLFRSEAPEIVTDAVRATVAFTPTDNISASLMYQRLNRQTNVYNQISGGGHLGGARPAGWNGPAITPEQRLAVQEDWGQNVDQTDEILTARAEWDLGPVRLEYTGGWTDSATFARSDADTANLIPGLPNVAYTTNLLPAEQSSNEIRLVSDTPGSMFDWVIGAQTFRADSAAHVNQPAFIAFGPAPTFRPAVVALSSNIDRIRHVEEISYFASGTLHIGEGTELTAGVRQLTNDTNNLTLGVGAPLVESEEETATLYNLSLSHELTDDILVYGTTGTAWRRGPAAVGVFNGAADPTLGQFSNLDAEDSVSYEIGFKSNWLDNRAMFNVALWHQEFDNLIIRNRNIPYRRVIPPGNTWAAGSNTTFNFTYTADSVVDGVDIEAGYHITDSWDIGAIVSYADGAVDDDIVPCNDGNDDGVEDNLPTTFVSGEFIRLCQSSGAVSNAAPWSATLSSEFSQPMFGTTEGFIRGLYNYYAENNDAGKAFTADGYGLLNLYFGLRGEDGTWEVSLFGRNILNEETVTFRDFYNQESTGVNPLVTGLPNYYATSMTPRQEFGVNARFAFGSR